MKIIYATSTPPVMGLAHSLAGRPDVARAINVRRRAMGLDEIPILPRRSRRSSGSVTTRVFVVAAPGRGDYWRHSDRPFQFAPSAWRLDEINDRFACWGIRSQGHRSSNIDTALFGRMRAETDPVAGLVVSWEPNMADPIARLTVAEINGGRRAVSIGFGARDVEGGRDINGRPIDIITRARLDHVALLATGEEPRLARASAWVFRSRVGGEAERQRQRDAAIKAALRLR